MQNPATTTTTSATPTTNSSIGAMLRAGLGNASPAIGASENSATGSVDPNHEDLRSLAMQQQQLLQAVQLQQSLNQSSSPVVGGGASSVLGLYQQLINQQLAQQQQQSQQQPVVGTPPHQQGITGLPNQFSASLQLQNTPSPSTLQHQLVGAVQQQHQPSAPALPAPQPSAASGLLGQLLASSPNLLQSLLGGGNQQLITLLVSALASQQQQHQQQQLQQQLLQQLLQNPLTANNLFAYQNLLQQQQATSTQPQLGLLSQLASQLTGNQPLQQLLASWLVPQQSQKLSLQPQPQQPPQVSQVHAQSLPPDVQQLLLRYVKDQQPNLEQQMGSPALNHPGLSLLSSLGAGGEFLPASGSASQQQTSQHGTPFTVGGESSCFTARQQQQQSLQPQPGSMVPERILSSESVQDHISRLISENEAIVEPNPVLLKRRPYHRQSTSNSINSQNSQECIGGSQRGSPGGTSQFPKTNTTRSQSLHESPLLSSLRLGGSLTSGQPIIRSRNSNSLTCNFCQLKFPNEAGLEAHEFRCSKKEQLTKQHSQPQLRHIPQLSGQQSGQQHLLRQLQQQQQQRLLVQQQHQSNIAALVGGGMGVAPDLVISTDDQRQQFLRTISNLTNASLASTTASVDELSRSAQKKRQLLDENEGEDAAGSSQQNNNMLIDVVTADDEPSPSASSSKIAKMDYGQLLQQVLVQVQKQQQEQQQRSISEAAPVTSVEEARSGTTPTLSLIQQIAESAITQREQQSLADQSAQKSIIQKAAAEYVASGQRQQIQTQQTQPPLYERDEARGERVEGVTATASTSGNSDGGTQVSTRSPNEMSGMIAYSLECIATRNGVTLPYLLTLGEKLVEELNNGSESPCTPITSTPYRNRNITSDTFVCLNRHRPNHEVQKKNGTNPTSAYADCWQQIHVDPEEGRVIFHFLSASSTKPRAGVMDDCCYTVANKLSRGLHTTHSSFWEMHNKHVVKTIANEVVATNSDVNYNRPAIELASTEQDNQMVSITTATNKQMPIDTNSSDPSMVTLPRSVHWEGTQSHGFNATPIETSRISDEMHAVSEIVVDHKVATLPKPKVRSAKFPQENDRWRPFQATMKLPATVSRAMLESAMKIGARTEEVDVYVRGRGRGRYVCDRCGIRCKKPSMLKKHIKSHTNIRPFSCITCNFSFKTKGNLTKHLMSKAHRRRMVDSKSFDERRANSVSRGSVGGVDEGDEEMGRLVVDESETEEKLAPTVELCDAPSIVKLSMLESRFIDDVYDWDTQENEDGDNNSSDSEDELAMEESMIAQANNPGITYRRYGQENILVERSTHTPPTLWGFTLLPSHDDMKFQWPKGETWDERPCHSAPPVTMCSPEPGNRMRRSSKRFSKSSKHVVEDEIGGEASSSTAGMHTMQPFLISDTREEQFSSVEDSHQLIANFIPKPVGQQRDQFNALLQQQQQQQSPLLNLAQNITSSTPQQSLVLDQNTSQAAAIDLNVLKITQPQLAALIASAILARSESQMVEYQQSGFVTAPLTWTNPPAQPQPTVVHPPIQPAQSTSSAMDSFLSAEEYGCTMCERKFRKESELNLHKQTHLIEHQQNAKSRIHYCHECKVNLRTKAALVKHMDTLHVSSTPGVGSVGVEQMDAESQSLPSGQSQQSSSTKDSFNTPNSLGHRSFVCTECNLGFRSHGVLGKHLRSKNHVKALINQGKLPSDAASLIKDNSHILGRVDATDCQSAKTSLLELLAAVRSGGKLYNSSVNEQTDSRGFGSPLNVSLECGERLGSVSPIFPQQQAATNGPVKEGLVGNRAVPVNSKTRPPVKRKNTEDGSTLGRESSRRKLETSPSSFHSDVAEHLYSTNSGGLGRGGASTSENHHPPTRDAKVSVPMIEGSEYEDANENHPASPLHSLAAVAVAAASSNSPLCVNSISNRSIHRASTTPSKAMMITNVWVPPRLDQIEVNLERRTPDSNGGAMGRETTKLLLEAGMISDSVGSNKSIEESSVSTGRSESSTPVQRTGGILGMNGIAESPAQVITRCQLCGVDFPTAVELQIHFHTQHVIMRDGRDYKCPRQNCERIYPNRETLRLHITAHYLGGGATTPEEEPGLADSPLDSNSCHGGTSPALRKKSSILHTPIIMAPSAPAIQSPGVPEETHTSRRGSGSQYLTANRASKQPTSRLCFDPTPATSSSTIVTLTCKMCGHIAGGETELQNHWLAQHYTLPIQQLMDGSRNFICKDCDAGFTTLDALKVHSSAHKSPSQKSCFSN